MANLHVIQDRIKDLRTNFSMQAVPKFPKKIMFEISNRCNHACVFCAHKRMNRPKADIDFGFFEKIAAEARGFGSREIGLHMGAEPFASPLLEQCVATSSRLGYEYIYFSTNGTLARPERMRAVIDNGVHSIKFSINGGTREVYKKIHGVDHFDKVCEHVAFADRYRKESGRPVYLSISFIETSENADTYDQLLQRFDPLVDEICRFPVHNPSGQIPGLPAMKRAKCHSPFTAAHVTVEGYLRVCCNDYNNYTAIEDLNVVSLLDAWRGERFVEIRRRFIEHKLDGTLCYNCLNGADTKIGPMNRDLCPYDMI